VRWREPTACVRFPLGELVTFPLAMLHCWQFRFRRSEYLNEFSARGAAVFCEKPFAVSEAEHRRIVGQFPVHALGCGYMRRFYGSTRLMRISLVQAGSDRWGDQDHGGRPLAA